MVHVVLVLAVHDDVGGWLDLFRSDLRPNSRSLWSQLGHCQLLESLILPFLFANEFPLNLRS